MPIRARVVTPWIGTGQSGDEYRPQLGEHHAVSGWTDVTSQPSENLMPDPNAYTIEVQADDDVMDQILADDRYLVLWHTEIVPDEPDAVPMAATGETVRLAPGQAESFLPAQAAGPDGDSTIDMPDDYMQERMQRAAADRESRRSGDASGPPHGKPKSVKPDEKIDRAARTKIRGKLKDFGFADADIETLAEDGMTRHDIAQAVIAKQRQAPKAAQQPVQPNTDNTTPTTDPAAENGGQTPVAPTPESPVDPKNPNKPNKQP